MNKLEYSVGFHYNDKYNEIYDNFNMFLCEIPDELGTIIQYSDLSLFKPNTCKYRVPLYGTSFSTINIYEAKSNGRSDIWDQKYTDNIRDVLHNIKIFVDYKNNKKNIIIDSFKYLYLYTLIKSYLSDINLNTDDNLNRLIENISENSILIELGTVYLSLKLLGEQIYISNRKFQNICENYKYINLLLDFIDETLLYIIHIILSYNNKKIISGDFNIITDLDIIFKELCDVFVFQSQCYLINNIFYRKKGDEYHTVSRIYFNHTSTIFKNKDINYLLHIKNIINKLTVYTDMAFSKFL
jgi:hypothetical protein